ncbi:hypothetical protein [Planococcus alpniumensis]|uniref:hypothetical protein n=1 Tax=Planococcus alpniumensis TaxID=2708345 RepID=UPI001B8C9ED1|nr:hypothetical protein [Planococcus sp. MSAK28401]
MSRTPNKFTVSLGIPNMASISGEWEPNENQQDASWEIYVELVTRVSVVGLKEDEGNVREALSSLYAIFAETRGILKRYGPGIAISPGKGDLSLGYIAVSVLNDFLRPFLTKWHPILLSHEETRNEGVSLMNHYKVWERDDEIREGLNQLSDFLYEYSKILAKGAGIPPLVEKSI